MADDLVMGKPIVAKHRKKRTLIIPNEKRLAGEDLENAVNGIYSDEKDREAEELESEPEEEEEETPAADEADDEDGMTSMSEKEQLRALLRQVKKEKAEMAQIKEELIAVKNAGSMTGVGAAINGFQDQWAQAISNHTGEGHAMIEAEDAVFNFYFRTLPKKPDHFWYQGVRVFRKGTMAKTLEAESVTINEKLFGKDAKVQGKFRGR